MAKGHHGRCPICGTKLMTSRDGKGLHCPKHCRKPEGAKA